MGHVDNGKSTTTGHLLYLSGVMTNEQSMLTKRSRENGQATFHFAWVLDNLKEDENVVSPLTFDSYNSQQEIQHDRYRRTRPQRLIKNMITGASQATHSPLQLSQERRV